MVLAFIFAFNNFAFSQEEEEAVKKPVATMPVAVKAIAAGIAMGLSGLGTGIAQSRIGAAGCGLIAERPEQAGMAIVLLAIPETVVILGFVIAAMIIFVM